MSEKEVSKESNKESNAEKKNQKSSKSKEVLEDPFYNPEVLTKVNVNINSSSSKQMYTIPKAERFKYSKVGVDSIYNLPSVMEKRSAGLGYGQKNDFTKGGMRGKTDSIYNIPREFDLNRRYGNSPKYTFGTGRENMIIPSTKIPNYPSPNQYNPYKVFGADSMKYSMRGRYDLRNKYDTPGPGSYKQMGINENGKYPSSELCNSIQNRFSGSERFKYAYNKNPGPGSYKSNFLINGNGIVYNSRYASNVGKSISGRFNFKSGEVTPGPGAYEFFSDFEGFNKKRYKVKKENKKNNQENEYIEKEEKDEEKKVQ
jgi:hypothetical protein